MTYIFERTTTERIWVRADDEDAAREKLSEVSESEWIVVGEPVIDLVRIDSDY